MFLYSPFPLNSLANISWDTLYIGDLGRKMYAKWPKSSLSHSLDQIGVCH